MFQANRSSRVYLYMDFVKIKFGPAAQKVADLSTIMTFVPSKKNQLIPQGKFSLWKLRFLYTLTIFAFYLVIQRFNLWEHFGVQEMNPSFADLRSIFSARDCFQINEPMQIYSKSCDIWNRPFNYPLPTIALASIVHFTQASMWILGDLYALLLISTLGYWFSYAYSKKPNYLTIVIFLMIGISPATLLLAERGNYDTVIFLLFTLGFFWAGKGKTKYASLTFFCAGLLKVYLIPLNLLLAFIDPNPKIRKLNFWLFTLNLFLFAPTAEVIYRNTPVSLANSFGFPFFFHLSGQSPIFVYFVVTVIFLISCLLIKFVSEITLYFHELRKRVFTSSEVLFLIALFGFCLPYFATVSFNYRIIFILPIAVLNYTNVNRRIRIMGLGLFLIQFLVSMSTTLMLSMYTNTMLLAIVLILLVESILHWKKSVSL